MKKILFVLFLCISIFVRGQVTFQKVFGETTGIIAETVKQTIDGGYILIGKSGIDTVDYCLIKTNSNGDLIWTRSFDSGAEFDWTYSGQQTSDGGYILCGEARFDNPFISTYIYLVRTNSSGDTLWTEFFTVTGSEIALSIEQTGDGGFIIAGEVWDSINWADDQYLIKTDSLGNYIWSKAYGNIFEDFSGSVQQTADSGYVLSGYSEISGLLCPSLIKTDSNGNILWSKAYNGYATTIYGYNVALTRDGGYLIVCGTVAFGNGDNDAYLIKTDSVGNVDWSKTYGGSSFDIGSFGQQTTDSGFIFTGWSNSFSFDSACDVYVVKTDASGNLIWSNHYGGPHDDYSSSIQQTNDFGFVVTGSTNGLGITGWVDAYLIKMNSNGNSGCNEGIAATIVSSVNTQVLNPNMTSYVPGTITLNTNSHVFIRGTELSLCQDDAISALEYIHSSNVSPNPFHSSATLTINSELAINNAQLKIYNSMGALVRVERVLNITSYILHRDGLSEGLYFYELRTTDSELIGNGKFVIE